MGRGQSNRRDIVAAQVEPARRAAGMSQVQLADAAGVSRRTVLNIERGHHIPHPDVLDRIASVLEMPEDSSPSAPEWLSSHVEIISALLPLIHEEHRNRLMQDYILQLTRTMKKQNTPTGRTVTKGLLE